MTKKQTAQLLIDAARREGAPASFLPRLYVHRNCPYCHGSALVEPAAHLRHHGIYSVCACVWGCCARSAFEIHDQLRGLGRLPASTIGPSWLDWVIDFESFTSAVRSRRPVTAKVLGRGLVAASLFPLASYLARR